VTALNPQNEKDAIEVAKITKISDVATVPESAKVQSNPFANQANKARQSEAKTYVGTLNKAQQAYFVEKNNWGQNIDVLGIGINTETDNYRYGTQIVSSIRTANIKNYPGISVQTGLAKKEGLKSYVGVVYLSNTSSNDVNSLSLLCESNEPTSNASGLPKFDGNTMLCPDGYNPLR
jgi:type II secretory pathway pseudopilin PulG